ncbi:MAG: ATP-binding protein [Bulleidia sp.]|nr:ATP-binding protein [Bulleidia sp.]
MPLNREIQIKKLIREKYLSRIRPFYYENEIIKVLVGVRRCGKSEILSQIRDELIKNGVDEESIVFINFDKRPYKSVHTARQLEKLLDEKVIPEQQMYIFLDEIQNVENFEPVVEAFRLEENCSIFITGSNSCLLSGELATKLTGRYVEFLIQPFSFQEVVDYGGNREETSVSFNKYLQYGGYPYIQHLDAAPAMQYIHSVIDEIFKTDLQKRLKIRNRSLFERILRFVCTNSGWTVSTESVIRYLKSEHIRTTVKTVSKYLAGIESAKIITKCPRYDIRGKKNLQYYEKVYIVDPAFRTYFMFGSPVDYSSLLETIVFNELLSRGYEVKIGKLKKGEVDFVVSNGNTLAYVQVTYLMADPSTKKREFQSLLAIRDGYKKVILSMDPINMSQNGIENISITDFLLQKKNIF